MRNPNGYGTTYKMHGNRRKPWVARITVKWDGKKGKQKYKTIGYYVDQPAALMALANYHQNPDEESRDKIFQQLYQEWSNSKYDKVALKTQQSYETAWKHLEPIKNKKVKDIRKSHIQKIIDKMHKEGLGYSSVHKVKVLAKMMMDDAMADDIIDKNYADLVELPKNEKKEKETFTDIEIDKLSKAAKNNEWASTIMILIYTGMRISELLTLTKFNVDLKGGFITGGIKTEAGKDRMVPIHSKIRKHIEYWMSKDDNTEYLVSRNGTRVLPNYYRKSLYYPVLEKLSMEKKSPHTARHTFATLLSKAGADTIAIQKMIGHADYSTTANIYTHKNLDELKKAIEKI